MPNIFIIIPVFNESEEVLYDVINKLKEYQFNIVVIDDGSTIPVDQMIKDQSVIILTHSVNLGQGAALQTGLEYSRTSNADIVVTFDADGQHQAGDIEKLLQPLLNGQADVTLGSRFLGESRSISVIKKFILHFARWINYLFTGILLTDAHNGLRAFNKTAIEKIVISENRMAHASEILFEIKKHRLRYIEVPVKIDYTRYAKAKGQSSWDSIKVLFDLVLHKLFK